MARTTVRNPLRGAFQRRIEERDLEVSARRGYLAVVAAVETGALPALWTQRFGEPIFPDDLAAATARLRGLFQ